MKSTLNDRCQFSILYKEIQYKRHPTPLLYPRIFVPNILFFAEKMVPTPTPTCLPLLYNCTPSLPMEKLPQYYIINTFRARIAEEDPVFCTRFVMLPS